MPSNTDDYSIGQVARKSGLAASAIRYYEERGLIRTPRRESGRRRYGEDVIARLALIGIAQDAGFSLAEIKTLVGGIADDGDTSTRLQKLAHKKLPELELQFAKLRMMKRILTAATQCSCPSLQSCLATARRAGLAPEA